MWRKQIKAERAAEQASQMVAKAKALKEAIMARPGSSGNEGSPSEDVSENEADNRSSTTLATLASKALVRGAESYRDSSSSSSESNFGDISGDDHKHDEHSGDDKSSDGRTREETLAETEALDAQEDARQAR